MEDKNMYSATLGGFQFLKRGSQHDELEPRLKKILRRNGIWGLKLESYYHVVSPTNLKKIRFCSPCEKNYKTLLSKVKSLHH